MPFDKAALFTSSDTSRVEVPCPEWPVNVWVHSMTAKQRKVFFEDDTDTDKESLEFRIKMIIAFACDENGNQLFTPDDADALQGRSVVVLDRICTAILDVNKMARGSVDEAKKNSSTTPPTVSTTS